MSKKKTHKSGNVNPARNKDDKEDDTNRPVKQQAQTSTETHSVDNKKPTKEAPNEADTESITSIKSDLGEMEAKLGTLDNVNVKMDKLINAFSKVFTISKSEEEDDSQ